MAKERRTAGISLSYADWLCFRKTNESEELSVSVYPCSATIEILSKQLGNCSMCWSSTTVSIHVLYSEITNRLAIFYNVLCGWIKWTCWQNVQVLGFSASQSPVTTDLRTMYVTGMESKDVGLFLTVTVGYRFIFIHFCTVSTSVHHHHIWFTINWVNSISLTTVWTRAHVRLSLTCDGRTVLYRLASISDGQRLTKVYSSVLTGGFNVGFTGGH